MKKILLISFLSLSLVMSICIAGCGDEHTPVESQFIASPITGIVPEDVQFTDQSIGTIDSWEWDFNNDGIVDSTEQNPQKTYNNPGNYTVSLTVRGSGGESTLVKTDYLEFTPCPRIAEFSVAQTTIEGVHPVQFTDLSTGDILTWEWDFDSDGEIDSTVQSPTYTYKRNGTYSVTLTVTTAECEDTLTKYEYITVTKCGS